MDEKNIHEAINAIMGQVGYVQKQRGQNLNYTYASEAALIEAVRPEMVAHGVYMAVDEITNVSREQYTTSKGSVMNSVSMLAKVRFTHAPSETSIVVWSHGEGSDSGDKASNKALTGLYKYAIRQTFCIETGDDPDKFPSSEQERASKPQPKPAVKSNGNGHRAAEIADELHPNMVETAKELGGVEKKLRLEPETLKAALIEKAATFKGVTQADQKIAGVVVANLEKCFAGNGGNPADKRHEFLKFVTGHASIKDVDPKMVLAISAWLAATQDSGGDWQPCEDAVREARAAVVYYEMQNGQQELL